MQRRLLTYAPPICATAHGTNTESSRPQCGRREVLWRVAALSAIGVAATKVLTVANAAENETDEEERRKRLSPLAYAVLRQGATERPFSSTLNAEKRAGTYR